MTQFRRVIDAPNGHPLVRRLIAEMNERRVPWTEVYTAAGVNHDILNRWRQRNAPAVQSLEACLNVLGLKLAIVPLDAPVSEPNGR